MLNMSYFCHLLEETDKKSSTREKNYHKNKTCGIGNNVVRMNSHIIINA